VGAACVSLVRLTAPSRSARPQPTRYGRVLARPARRRAHTFLVDGVVEGWWRPEGGGILREPFGRLDPSVRRELDAEAERLRAFLP
jgi:hypothetical protein